MTPPAPNPCRARPRMKRGMVGANPDTTRPTVKAEMPPRSGNRGPWASEYSPAATVENRLVTRNALNAQPYKGSPWSSWTATGMAVATAMASNATRNTTPKMPAVRPLSRGPKTLSGPGRFTCRARRLPRRRPSSTRRYSLRCGRTGKLARVPVWGSRPCRTGATTGAR